MSESVVQHFQRHFGPWTNRVEYPRTVPAEPSVWIYEWPREQMGITSFTTVGYSDVRLPATASTHRIEFLFSAKAVSFDEAAHVLLTGCETPLDDHQPLRLGHTVGPLRDPIGQGMTRLLFTSPWEEESFDLIELGNRHAEILMIVPLFESELVFLRQHGEEGLWQELESQAIDITDLHRSAATLVR